MKKIIIICIFVISCISLDAQVKCNGGLFFKLEHKATRVSGNMVAVDFMLTNKTGSDIDIRFLNESSSIMDNRGGTYSGYNVKFDFANTGYDRGMIPEHASVKLRCIVSNLDDRATSLAFMNMKYKCSLSEDGDDWSLFARKVSLTE